ncbi:MAG TPA: HAMP domain-containing sensor histidine kinase [Steroidobacteraceae bacterium]|nr:HAMP domain-containing sensor histidine kinase [Steroidobacteraceae bacterium]
MTRTAADVSDGTHEQIIAIVAHELRHPLMPIRNAAALLRQEAPDAATVLRAAEIIERQALAMHRLIGDLVDVSRTQFGALELRRVRAPLTELVECAIESAGPTATERGHTLLVSISPQPIYLNMDVLRLGQALHNIISNASKYTDKQGHVHVRAQREGAEVVVVVSDTGIGIPPAELEKIFGLFVQSAQGARVEPGLGLGLYLARHLIEAHDGTVTAASDGPGRGSVFTVRLPCEASDAETAGDPSPV